MKPPKWNDIQKALREGVPPPPVRDETEFWSDFRARAELGPGPDAEATVARAGLPWRLGWTLAVSAVVCIVAVSVFRTRTPSPHALTTTTRSEVEDIEVFVPYTSMMIMQDVSSGGSVVWLADLDPEQSLGEGDT